MRMSGRAPVVGATRGTTTFIASSPVTPSETEPLPCAPTIDRSPVSPVVKSKRTGELIR